MNKHYFKYWGKARKEGETGLAYHLLPYHCLDVAAVGFYMLNKHSYLVNQIQRITKTPMNILRPWLLFMFAAHDPGKFAEAFQQLEAEIREAWWGNIKKKSYDIRHDSLGFILWHDPAGLAASYKEEAGLFDDQVFSRLFRKALTPWLEAVTGHHGLPPAYSDQRKRVKNYFRDFDVLAARLFFDDLAKMYQPDTKALLDLSADKEWRNAQKESAWLIAGLTVLCDWLGSDREIFKYCDEPMELAVYWEKYALPRALQAIEKAGMQFSKPAREKSVPELFEKIQTSTPLQGFCSQVKLADSPQLFILEDVTGAGKTEAALTLVHRLMAKDQAEGVFVALPTMATANAMYERMALVYHRFYAEGERPSLVLSHGARHLSELFQQSLFNFSLKDSPYSDKEDTASVQCSRWLADSRKKSLLADVSIGTIDQALLGILPARHQSLRLYGLANKVLLVDEVHAYDHYMFPLLKRLIEFHSRFGGSVVLLSATLPMAMRQELVDAYFTGRKLPLQILKEKRYPLVTNATEMQAPVERHIATRNEVERTVQVQFVRDVESVFHLIKAAVINEQCVCWVRNTVDDAREAYDLLAQESWLDADRLMLFHSRFLLGHRLEIEQRTLDCFGEQSGFEERRGRVLIATQVVEQSLDLDADIMISDLAPVDLLIQRAGRLHRHVRIALGDRDRRQGAVDQRQGPIFSLLSPCLDSEPDKDWYKSLFPKGVYVYPHAGMLWNTAQLLKQKGGWRMPDDARELIEGVYGEVAAPIPEALLQASEEAEGEWWANKSLATFNALNIESGYSLENAWDDEARIPTRLAEDSATVYLALWDGECLTPLVNKGRFPWDLSSLNVSAKKISGIPKGVPGWEAVQELRKTEKLFDESSLIVPVVQISERSWEGSVLDSDGSSKNWRYEVGFGLITD